MQANVQTHEAWLVRPEDLKRVMALLAGLEMPPPGAGPRQATAATAPTLRTTKSRSIRKTMPRPSRPAGSGRRLGAADRRAGRGRADGRSAAPGLEQQAGPRRQGADPELRQEERPAVEDRRLEPAAGRGGVPVRPVAIAPIILPTPRADAFRAGLPACRGHWTRRQLVTWRRIVPEEVLGRLRPGRE